MHRNAWHSLYRAVVSVGAAEFRGAGMLLLQVRAMCSHSGAEEMRLVLCIGRVGQGAKILLQGHVRLDTSWLAPALNKVCVSAPSVSLGLCPDAAFCPSPPYSPFPSLPTQHGIFWV